MTVPFLFLMMFSPRLHPQLSLGSLFFLVLLGSYWLYHFGLTGIFLADDHANLVSLADIRLFDWNDIGQFLLEAQGGALKRPVAMFSFVLQAPYWPLSPWVFKYVNVLIHLVNGCLLFWLVLTLAPVFLPKTTEKQQHSIALLTCALWLLHPLNVSTVLYVVQRMTELNALFVFLALLLYSKGRLALADQRLVLGYGLVSSSLLAGLFALFSKENGVLLIFYLLLLEYVAFKTHAKPAHWRLWQTLFLYLPALLIIYYFSLLAIHSPQTYSHRPFTMTERLLTEGRIVVGYLQQILLPNPNKLGLIHDTITVSKSGWQPVTTLVSLLFLATLAVFALIKRQKYPLFAFAVGFFFIGHLLESTFISLELYFEHRNYLPMIGWVFWLAHVGLWLWQKMQKPLLRKLYYTAISLYLFSFPYLTYSQTTLWGKPLQQALTWAARYPDSHFAQSYSALILYDYQQYAQAKQGHQSILAHFPLAQAQVEYFYIQHLNCRQPELQQADENALRALMTGLKFPVAVTLDIISGLNLMVDDYGKGCALDLGALHQVFQVLIEQRNSDAYLPYLYQAYARLFATEKNYPQALHYLTLVLALQDNARIRMQKLHLLMTAQQFPAALAFIRETLQQKSLELKLYQAELKKTERLLIEVIDYQNYYLNLKKNEPKPQYHPALSE